MLESLFSGGERRRSRERMKLAKNVGKVVGAAAAAVTLVGGIASMERGALSHEASGKLFQTAKNETAGRALGGEDVRKADGLKASFNFEYKGKKIWVELKNPVRVETDDTYKGRNYLEGLGGVVAPEVVGTTNSSFVSVNIHPFERQNKDGSLDAQVFFNNETESVGNAHVRLEQATADESFDPVGLLPLPFERIIDRHSTTVISSVTGPNQADVSHPTVATVSM